MGVEVYVRDRDSIQNDHRTGSIATGRCIVEGTLPDGTKFGPIEVADSDHFVVEVRELDGRRPSDDEVRAVYESKQVDLDAEEAAARLAVEESE